MSLKICWKWPRLVPLMMDMMHFRAALKKLFSFVSDCHKGGKQRIEETG